MSTGGSRFRRGGHHGAHAAGRGRPGSVLHRAVTPRARTLSASRHDSRLGVHHLPGDHGGELLAPLLEDESGLTVGTDFHLGYSPERIDPGNTNWTFVNTPKVVAGHPPGAGTASRGVDPQARHPLENLKITGNSVFTGSDGAFTTVAHWRSYGTIWHDGVQYSQKVHALRPLLALPGHVDERLRPALSIHADERDDLAALDEHGWSYVDPSEVAATPEAYQAFLRGSKAELAVAKSGYIEGRTGWFSDRSVCYLASGRPVVAHDTGFPSYLPTGEGLLAFRDLPGAAEAIAAVADDYTRHTGAARAIAEEHFGARAVLGSLLDALGAAT